MSVMVVRPASDIAEAIRKEIIRPYDPLKQARDYFNVEVDDLGNVKVTGNVRSGQAHRVLIDGISDIEGVNSFDYSDFHEDDELRFKIGKLLPHGVITRVNFGYVVLAGNLPANVDENALVAQVASIAGVRKVVTQFS